MGRAMGWSRRLLSAPLTVALLATGGISATVVVLSAAPAGATTVSTEAQLRAAFDTDSSIVLANDINLTDCGSGDVTRNTGGTALVLDGAGHTVTQTCTGFRVFFNATTDALTFKNVTITGGNVNDFSGGGGIHLDNHSDLTVINSAIVNNLTCEQGGGIELDSGGNLTVTNSTIANNTATSRDGGGIANVDDPTDKMIITNSTISNNTAVNVGGVEVDGGSLQLIYSTVTDNTRDPNLTCPASLESARSTQHAASKAKHAEQGKTHEAAPEAGVQGGVGAQAGSVPANIRVEDQPPEALTSFGSVVALPHGGPNCDSFAPNPLTNTTSNGYNFSDDTSCGFTNTTSGDRQNAGDPMLGALANNLPTTVTMPAPLRQTRLPQTGSPLIDAIPAASCSSDGASTISPLTDERSVVRPQGPGCDIGAVEIEVPVPVAVILAPRFTG